MRTLNKYIIAISSTVLVGVGVTSAVVLGSNKLTPVVPTLNLKLTNIGKSLTPKEFVENVFINESIDRNTLDSYVSGLPNYEDESFSEINSNYIVNVQKVTYSVGEDTNFVNVSVLFQSKQSSFSRVINYKLEGLQFESQRLFNNLVVSANASAKNVLASQVTSRNYKQYVRFNIQENFPQLDTTATFFVQKVTSYDNLGSLEISLVYKKDAFQVYKKVNVSGFKTTDAYDSEQLKRFIAEINVTGNPYLAPITLPSEVTKTNLRDYVNINSTSSLLGVQTTITDIVSLDDSGILKINMRFKYNKSVETKEFTVNNFQTFTQRRRMLFEQFCATIQLGVNSSGAVIRASQVNIDNLRVYVDGIPNDSSYPIKILSVDTNDLKGSITVRLEVTGDNGANQKIIKQEVNGFFIPNN